MRMRVCKEKVGAAAAEQAAHVSCVIVID